MTAAALKHGFPMGGGGEEELEALLFWSEQGRHTGQLPQHILKEFS